MGHYDGVEVKSMAEVFSFVEHNRDRLKCIGCSKPLSEVGYHYSFERHSGGLFVREFGENVWIWITCHRCGYQNALWKLMRQI